MAKIVARNASIYLDDTNAACQSMSGDMNNVSFEYTSEPIDVTAFGNSDRQNVPDGIKSWTFSMTGFVHDTAGTTCILFPLLSGSTYIQFGPNGSAAGGIKYTASAILQTLSQEYAVDGAATFSAEVISRTGSISASTW